MDWLLQLVRSEHGIWVMAVAAAAVWFLGGKVGGVKALWEKVAALLGRRGEPSQQSRLDAARDLIHCCKACEQEGCSEAAKELAAKMEAVLPQVLFHCNK